MNRVVEARKLVDEDDGLDGENTTMKNDYLNQMKEKVRVLLQKNSNSTA